MGLTRISSLPKKYIENVLNIYIYNTITDCEIEKWANLIECRDDIGFESELVKQIIYELANPLLTYKLTKEKAYSILDRLKEN